MTYLQNHAQWFLPLLLIIAIVAACDKDDPVKPPPLPTVTVVEQQQIGFEDKLAVAMDLEDPYLYVAAGSAGIWRRDIRSLTDWEYLGLADSILGHYLKVGATDLDVFGQDILVAFVKNNLGVDPDSTIGIWRSTTAGSNWFRSDSGIPETIEDGFSIIEGIGRSPHNPAIVFSCLEGNIYKSTNGGNNWSMIRGEQGILLGQGYLEWHPYREGEAWFFGDDALFAAYLFSRRNYGDQHGGSVPWFEDIGFPSDSAVYDVGFDSGDPDIIYALTSMGLIKATDGGYDWQVGGFEFPDGAAYNVLGDPLHPGITYFCGSNRLYYSNNGARDIYTLTEIDTGYVMTMLFDKSQREVIIGTTAGIYLVKIAYEY
ncbi:MAG: hypothetical protein B6244_14555 [Candidatus Cloacimonetes bacterium 4572_55]|nr:MAG: hypothetical protein B6244_14555 [Candidatus Cloacimonetes bacterium 4572_55]